MFSFLHTHMLRLGYSIHIMQCIRFANVSGTVLQNQQPYSNLTQAFVCGFALWLYICVGLARVIYSSFKLHIQEMLLLLICMSLLSKLKRIGCPVVHFLHAAM